MKMRAKVTKNISKCTTPDPEPTVTSQESLIVILESSAVNLSRENKGKLMAMSTSYV